jgi:ribosomal protein S12 methylthiotransferase
MTINPSQNRPDVIKNNTFKTIRKAGSPTIGIVSLGCPKALVDSESIIKRLSNEGYSISSNYNHAQAVIVNTCGFLDSAKAESLEAIGEAIDNNGKVIVTGCLGAKGDEIRKIHPSVLAITGPQQYKEVLDAVHKAVPPVHNEFQSLIPPPNISLTPKHYSYLKISEGCNHKCKFCIIPDLRGPLKSRTITGIIREAENLVASGVKELLIISQDTSAYGLDLKKKQGITINKNAPQGIELLARQLAKLNIWIRLHYVYPYPHVRKLIPLMSENLILPYLDIPFQHSHPDTLKRMARPANQIKTLEEINSWRKICPDINLRSTFIVGYPGETNEEFNHLLNWLDEAQLDRVGCFKYENVEGARSNRLENQCPEQLKQERWELFMEKSQTISERKLNKKIGSIQDAIVDEVDSKGAICRTKYDAPEIDGNLFIDRKFLSLSKGDIIKVKIEASSEYDLWGTPI